jgi:hypothetical protein
MLLIVQFSPSSNPAQNVDFWCRGQDLNLRTAGERILSPPDLTALQPRQQTVVPPIVQEDYSSSLTISRPVGRGGATS